MPDRRGVGPGWPLNCAARSRSGRRAAPSGHKAHRRASSINLGLASSTVDQGGGASARCPPLKGSLVGRTASFDRNFLRSVHAEFGDRADGAIVAASRGSLLVWRAYAFLAPGGDPYDPNKPLAHQLGQHSVIDRGWATSFTRPRLPGAMPAWMTS